MPTSSPSALSTVTFTQPPQSRDQGPTDPRARHGVGETSYLSNSRDWAAPGTPSSDVLRRLAGAKLGAKADSRRCTKPDTDGHRLKDLSVKPAGFGLRSTAERDPRISRSTRSSQDACVAASPLRITLPAPLHASRQPPDSLRSALTTPLRPTTGTYQWTRLRWSTNQSESHDAHIKLDPTLLYRSAQRRPRVLRSRVARVAAQQAPAIHRSVPLTIWLPRSRWPTHARSATRQTLP